MNIFKLIVLYYEKMWNFIYKNVVLQNHTTSE